LLEKDLPWLSEQATVVALGCLRSLLRAPEVKMLLLTPLIMLGIFGSMLVTRRLDLPLAMRPLTAFGAMAMVLFTTSQLLGNQFGLDRSGFRVFVLGPAPRRDILLGKNLGTAPLTLGMGLVVAAVLQAVFPMRLDHCLALLPQFVSMYLLFCLLANLLSIFAPMAMGIGTLKPVNTKGLTFLLQFVFTLLAPLFLAPTLLPLGVEVALEQAGWVQGWPLYLLLSVVECAAVVWLYRQVLHWQGDLLQAREQRILELVTAKESR
jgi:ABC-2 type transport system permease protein